MSPSAKILYSVQDDKETLLASSVAFKAGGNLELYFGKVVACREWGGLIELDYTHQTVKAYKGAFRVVDKGQDPGDPPKFGNKCGGFPPIKTRMVVQLDDPKLFDQRPKAYRCGLEKEWIRRDPAFHLVGVLPSGLEMPVTSITSDELANWPSQETMKDLRDKGYIAAFLRRNNEDGTERDWPRIEL